MFYGARAPVLDSSTVGLNYLEALGNIFELPDCAKSDALTFRTPDIASLSGGRAALGFT